MSTLGGTANFTGVELSDASTWNSNGVTGGLESGANLSSGQPQNGLVPLQLEEGLHLHSNDEKLAAGWKGKMTRALRINQSAGGMSLGRALLLVGLSFFFVLTTSLLVTGFQGLLPALIKDGVRRQETLRESSSHNQGEAYLKPWSKNRGSTFSPEPALSSIRLLSRLPFRIKPSPLHVSLFHLFLLQNTIV